MRLPILTARYWTLGRLEIAPGWLMVSWRDRDWSLACFSCGRFTRGCKDHRWCGLCEPCRVVLEDDANVV